MAVYIESRYNDGYMAHHAQDMMRVNIIHRLEDGYLLSYDKEVIKEQLPLKDFIIRLRQVEGAQRESLEEEIRRIDGALRQRKEREICDWLDHRYSKIIREKRAVLMEHTHSVNIRHVNLPVEFHSESGGNTERSVTQSVGAMEHMKEENMHVHKPMTYDEAFRVDDKEVYYLLT